MVRRDHITRRFPDLFIASAPELASEFARRVTHVARDSVRERGRFSLAIPGGSVARAFLPALGASAMPWESTTLFWVDERAVSEDDPESNAGVARDLLVRTPAASLGHLRPMSGVGDLDDGARAYAELMVRELGMPPVLDVVLLGVGDDGHVASLFPGHELAGQWVAGEMAAPKPPRERLTLTYETLAVARVVCIAALGVEKASIVSRMLDGSALGLPVARVLAGASVAWVLVDHEAGSLVGGVQTMR